MWWICSLLFEKWSTEQSHCTQWFTLHWLNHANCAGLLQNNCTDFWTRQAGQLELGIVPVHCMWHHVDALDTCSSHWKTQRQLKVHSVHSTTYSRPLSFFISLSFSHPKHRITSRHYSCEPWSPFLSGKSEVASHFISWNSFLVIWSDTAELLM